MATKVASRKNTLVMSFFMVDLIILVWFDLGRTPKIVSNRCGFSRAISPGEVDEFLGWFAVRLCLKNYYRRSSPELQLVDIGRLIDLGPLNL